MSNSLQRIPSHSDGSNEHEDWCECSKCVPQSMEQKHVPESFSEWIAQTNQHIDSPESMEQNYNEHHNENSHD